MPEKRVLLLQDWYAENDLLNPSFFALLELFPQAQVGFLKNLERSVPAVLRDRHVEFYASRFARKAFENLEELIAAEALIPIDDFDLVFVNTRGYLKHLRREKSATTRIIAYQHDLLPYLWRVDVEALNAPRTAELLRLQEIDLEYSMGVDLTIAANYALRATLAALTRQKVPLAYPLVDGELFFPDTSAEAEYFLATEATDLPALVHLFSCVTDKLVIMAEEKPDKLLKELKPDNIFYTGKISNSEKAYYLGGAKALILGETRELDHLGLAALKAGVPVIAHPSQGMHEFLHDTDLGHELRTGSAEEILYLVRSYRELRPERESIHSGVEWLNREYFLRRLRKALDHHT
ncbi:hypothetical protein [Turneriella parva]|uniref:Glycosyl transferase group 1 n=1 Tax=Turneriella parva (strain ATCC BAA-1111 / DSM 21527 / NCTC 11395 / H) TaxID=869212 RepID=I4B8M0_TURPD|nr:hypothetical protein [Turneriella parva]AFM13627.1 hypothetical protein Turpa_2988 [Turneriella parva DSM 21527]